MRIKRGSRPLFARPMADQGLAWPRLQWHFDPGICIHAPPPAYKAASTGWFVVCLMVFCRCQGRLLLRRLLSVPRSFVVVEVVCLELVEVEGRAAEGSRDAEEGSGARVRRSRCGPETPLVGRSVRHSPLPTPSINNSPMQAEIAPETPFVPHPNRGVERPTRACAKHAAGAHRPRQRSSELRSREEDSTAAQREVPSFLWGFVCVFVAPVRQVRTV